MQLSSQLIEELAFAACQAIDQTVRVPAQQKWSEFVLRQLRIQHYEWFLQNHSQQALFAFTLLLKENIISINDLFQVMDKISSILMKWFLPNGTFLRQNQEPLQKHVESTFGNFLGICLKHFFRSKSNEKLIIEWLINSNVTAHYRLYLFYNFIDSISFIDDKIPFIQYRTISNNFQDSIIPLIIQSLIPYFMNFEEAMEVTELAVLQDNMYLSDAQLRSVEKSQLAIWNQFNKFTFIIFKVLQQVIAFRYNICYKQFDGDIYDDFKISFPDNLVKKIINKEFLEALYNIISKLMKINEHNYLSICLNCLNKVLMAKTTYFVTHIKEKFMITNLKGVYHLLCIWKDSQIKDKNIAIQIIQCNIKILTAFNLRQMETLSTANKDLNQIFIKWMVFIKELPVFVLESEKANLNSQNQLLLSSVELLKELIDYLKINKMAFYYPTFQEKCIQFTDKFLLYFIVQHRQLIMADQTFANLEQLKQPLKRFFNDIKIIMTANYSHTFQRIWEICTYLYHNPGYQQQIGNLIFLLLQIISEDCKYFEQSIFGDDILRGRSRHLIDQQIADRQQLSLFGQILTQTISYIQRYTQKTCQYLNQAIILFIERLTYNCINKLTGHECIEEVHVPPTISYFLYKKMRRLRHINKDEDFINFCLAVISSFIFFIQTQNIEYVFQLLYQIIIRTKMAMQREYFKDTQIYKDMLLLFNNLSKLILKDDCIKCRVLLYKSMTALSFDDLLDSYRSNIRHAIGLVKHSIQQQDYKKVMYDLTGMCQSIETDSIYNYFMIRLMKEINVKALIQHMFSNVVCNMKDLKDLLNLNYQLINNRGRRFDSGKIIKQAYQLIEYMLPCWNVILNKYGETEEGEEICLDFYHIFNAIVKQKHINLCLLDRYVSIQYKFFIKLFLKNTVFMIQIISQYPELTSPFYQVLEDIFVEALQPWLNNEDMEIGKLLNLLVEKIMYKLTHNKNQEYTKKIDPTECSSSILQAELRIIYHFYKFIDENKQYIHRLNMLQNFNCILEPTANKNMFVIAAIKIGFEYGRQHRQILNYVSNSCVSMLKYYDFDIKTISNELGIKQEKDEIQFKRIVQNIKSRKQEGWIVVQLKDWIKSQFRFMQLHDSSEPFNDY